MSQANKTLRINALVTTKVVLFGTVDSYTIAYDNDKYYSFYLIE